MSLIRWLLGFLPYHAEWELPPIYKLARRVGGITRKARSVA